MIHPDPEQLVVGPAIDQALRLFMAGRDVPCPHCGYNLRGLATTLCPECGRAVTPELLRRAASRRRRRPLLIAFALLLVLNGIGAWYQWTSTSQSRRAWIQLRLSVARAPSDGEEQERLRKEHAAAQLAHVKVPSEVNASHVERSALDLASFEMQQHLRNTVLRDVGVFGWFTLTWWKKSLFDHPHALFVLGAFTSALSLAMLLIWNEAARAWLIWRVLGVALVANGLFGLSLLLK